MFFIDTSWRLNELVIDLVDLDGDHSGSLMGTLVYKALKAKGIARQAIACVTDNASSNSVLNETLAARIRQHEDVHAHGKNMSFTCITHAIHLVCTELTSHLGVIEPGDHFPEVKGSNLEGDTSDEEEEIAWDSKLDPMLDTESDSNFDNDFLAELAPELANTDDEKPKGRGSKRRQPRTLTVLEKAIVYATGSPKRKKEMREIIEKTCSKDAIAYFVSNLDSTQSRRGKSRKLIQKMQVRWNITGEEWDLGVMVGKVLDPFHTATEAMSRRDAATLADVIPTFSLLERKLLDHISQLQNTITDHGNATTQALLSGLNAALVKWVLFPYMVECRLKADFLTPRFRLKYLTRWPELHRNASILVSHIFENYRVKGGAAANMPTDVTPRYHLPKSSKPANTWDSELYLDVPSFEEHFDRELQAYYSGNYPCPSGMGTLDWWRVHHLHFPTVAHMARDFLCIPASSVSVERLFSQCKLTLTDHWMKASIDEDAIRMALEIDETINESTD
ncbi:Pc24g02420 [Rhizoctonia solani]|uniref:Pc24g02420 n=1 Tax=Rhizoctonia solani TaxID=456999 RepID=A0A0K6G0A6_9AGAM|nr:Pc24g02420 [Rhizoctonia solani]